ncbi:MAG: YbaB/EbfC family nucleoid-associated protein [Enterocloster sp.]
MAKRGGFPGGMPGNMNNLMKQAQRMQRQMEETTKELEEKEYTAKPAAALLTVTVSGKEEFLLKLSEEVVDPDDIGMLQDLIVAATNRAFRKMEAANSEAMSKLTGGLGGALGGGFPLQWTTIAVRSPS